MQQLFVFIFLILGLKLSYAQNSAISAAIPSEFEGTWLYKTRFLNNAIKIKFEPGKDYALFTDIGSGEAPPKTLKAAIKGKLLIIPAVQNQNDEVEMQIIGRKLYLRTRQVLWDKEGNKVYADKNQTNQRIFNRIK